MYIASFYDSAGRIIGVLRGPRESVEATAEVTGIPFVEGEGNAELQYVKEGAIVARPASPVVLTRHTLSGIPAPSVIRIGNAEYPCAESVADLEFGHTGTFQVTVEAWPYLNKEFTVENPPL